jgi:hypothetical protein
MVMSLFYGVSGSLFELVEQDFYTEPLKLNQQVVDRLTELKQTVLQQQKQTSQASKATQAYSRNQQYHSGLLASS